MSDFASRDEILQVQDIPFEDVVVPEWNNKKVRVMGMDAKSAGKFSSSMVEVDGKGNVKAIALDNFMADLLVKTLVNEKGQPIFTQADIEALGKKSAKVMKRLSDIAAKLSGLNDSTPADLLKNLSGTPGDASPSA